MVKIVVGRGVCEKMVVNFLIDEIDFFSLVIYYFYI